jgi:hypothetical protein
MEVIKMANTQTIQISIYKSFEKSQSESEMYNNYDCNNDYYSHLEEFEFVYEAEISSVADFLALTYRFDKQVKYKKPTDKNWYTAKTMVKRLFKNEVAKNKPIIKIAEINCWKQKREEKRLKAIAAAERKAADYGP